jgi:2-hydroxychromene-2-carboxylate isomerase
MKMSKTVDYYLSPASPYCYLGGKRLPDLIATSGAELRLKPASMAVIFPKTGGVHVAQRPPARLAYRLVELARWRDHWGLPMNIEPAHFPVNDAKALRMIVAGVQSGGNALALANAIGACVWEQEKDISDLATLIDTANGAGLDGAALVEAMDSEAVAQELERNNQEALAVGVFGVPWFVHDGTNYWGQDRIEFLQRALAP